MAMPGKPSRILAMPSVSQVSGLACAIGSNGLLGKRIELAILRVTLDGSIEPIGFERVKPRTKPRQLAWRQLFDGLKGTARRRVKPHFGWAKPVR